MEAKRKYQTLQRVVTKFLLPFSFLSVILSYPSLQRFQLSVQTLQLSSFSIGKNCMFLLCNGILVLIVRSSGLMGKHSGGIPQRGFGVQIVEGNGSEEEEELVLVGENEDGIELMSAEELNKKCEDFIRKMKAGIKYL